MHFHHNKKRRNGEFPSFKFCRNNIPKQRYILVFQGSRCACFPPPPKSTFVGGSEPQRDSSSVSPSSLYRSPPRPGPASKPPRQPVKAAWPPIDASPAAPLSGRIAAALSVKALSHVLKKKKKVLEMGRELTSGETGLKNQKTAEKNC